MREARLGRAHLVQHVLDDHDEVTGRHAHGAGRRVELREMAGARDPRRLPVVRPVAAGQEHQLGDVDLHRADILAALAQGAAPDPGRRRQLLVHPEHGHADELARIHVLQTRCRASRRTQTAGQAGVEIGARRQQLERCLLEVEGGDRGLRHGSGSAGDTGYPGPPRRDQAGTPIGINTTGNSPAGRRSSRATAASSKPPMTMAPRPRAAACSARFCAAAPASKAT